MIRLFKILIHIGIFAAGIACLAYADFFSWEILRGLLLPMAGIGFFIYLIAFLLSGGYRVLLPSASKTDSAP